MQLLAWLTWNPSREFFRIPYVDHPVTWYGCLFAFGFFLGFFILAYLFEQTLKTPREKTLFLTDRMTWFVIIGTIIGARLGHVFFYDWPRYKENPIDILKVWEGGLASHGGAIGILIALFFFQRWIRKQYAELTFLRLLDMLCIPTALAAFFIRIGNFMNQEILGNPTTVPWAIIFQNPIDGQEVLPRHPAQLYEASAYLAVFVLLITLWAKKGSRLKQGIITGLFFTLVFGSRFFIEYVKTPLSLMRDESWIQTGQILSIPFIIIGIILLSYNLIKNKILTIN